MTPHNHTTERELLVNSLRHPADPTYVGGVERRMFVAGHWTRPDKITVGQARLHLQDLEPCDQ